MTAPDRAEDDRETAEHVGRMRVAVSKTSAAGTPALAVLLRE
jgi:hypothetical protein